MDVGEAARLGEKLKGLFPASTEEQAKLFFDRIENRDASIVAAAIEAHAEKNRQLDMPNLLEAIKERTARHAITRPQHFLGTPEHDRALARMKDWAREMRAMLRAQKGQSSTGGTK